MLHRSVPHVPLGHHRDVKTAASALATLNAMFTAVEDRAGGATTER